MVTSLRERKTQLKNWPYVASCSRRWCLVDNTLTSISAWQGNFPLYVKSGNIPSNWYHVNQYSLTHATWEGDRHHVSESTNDTFLTSTIVWTHDQDYSFQAVVSDRPGVRMLSLKRCWTNGIFPHRLTVRTYSNSILFINNRFRQFILPLILQIN